MGNDFCEQCGWPVQACQCATANPLAFDSDEPTYPDEEDPEIDDDVDREDDNWFEDPDMGAR